MKKTAIALFLVLTLALTLCACGGKKEETKTEEENANMVNPWSEFDTAEKAAENAKIEVFKLAETDISLGRTTVSVYRSMEGMIELDLEFPASQVILRKAVYVGDGDASGVYTTYKNTWTQTVDGVELKCEGDKAGAAAKTTWVNGNFMYSIFARPLGGEDDFGLSDEDVAALVRAIG